MKRTLYTVLGDWREKPDAQTILYQGFNKKLALKAALKYFKEAEVDQEHGFFYGKTGKDSYNFCLKNLGIQKFLDRYADGYWNTAATILTKRIEV